MPVRFKFRSSVGFDTVDLGGRGSISVRDLKARIVEQKNLRIGGDFDLLISDAETEEGYEDQEVMIPEGSSVVVKRVPAVSVSAGAAGNSMTKNLNAFASTPSKIINEDAFDDFGNDLYPALDVTLPDSDAVSDNVNQSSSIEGDVDQRCLEEVAFRYHHTERSNISEAVLKDDFVENCEVVGNTDENYDSTKLSPEMEEYKNLNRKDTAPSHMILNLDLPMELKCSICSRIFKEAVMIPCCQHSFCDKCIRLVLAEKSRCPKCSSTRCGVGDLLPNLSLRQAIEHFPEPLQFSGSDKINFKYVPDVESGIQAKDVSHAVSVHRQEPLLPDSPSATGKGSNQPLTESVYNSKVKNKIKGKAAGAASRIIHLNAAKSVKSSSQEMKLSQREIKSTPKDLNCAGDPQAGLNSTLHHGHLLKNEVSTLTKKKKGLFGNAPDFGSMATSSKHRKGDRFCYMCGSPDHLFRECPASVSTAYPMIQPGSIPPYGQHYWLGTSFPHVRPYGNLYPTSAGMMPFDHRMVPSSPFAVSSYMPSLYSGLPMPCGFFGMGSAMPSGFPTAERPLSHAEVLERQESEKNHWRINEQKRREQAYDGDANLAQECHYNSPMKSLDKKIESDTDASECHSGYENPSFHKKLSHAKRSYSPSHHRSDFTSEDETFSADSEYVKGRSDHILHYADKQKSEVQDVSSSCHRHGKKRKKHHHRSSHEKHSEIQCTTDFSVKSHHRNQDYRERVASDHKLKIHKQHHLDSSVDPYSSSHKRNHHKEKELFQICKDAKDKDVFSDDLLVNDRWEMIDASPESYIEEHSFMKHRRRH